jgi:hypothetical protein
MYGDFVISKGILKPFLKTNFNNMRTLLILILIFKYQAINAQDTYIKFINPAIVGPIVGTGIAGSFLLESADYNLQSISGKIIPGSIKVSISEEVKIPEIWNAYLSSVPVEAEIYQFRNGQTPKLVLTIKLRDSYINAIRFGTNTDKAASHEIDLWMNKFFFEYINYDENGFVKTKHNSGWDFVKNTSIKF